MSSMRQFALPVPGDPAKMLRFNVPAGFWVPKMLATKGLASYERDTLAAFLALLDTAGEGDVLDVGANVGLFALLGAATHPDRRVTAFEPTPDLCDAIRITAEASNLAVDVQQAAAGVTDDTAELYLSNVTDASNSLREGFRQASGTIEVGVRSLDSWCREAGVRPSVVKIDTETTEPDVLQGFRSTLETVRPHVICEVLPIETEQPLESLFGELGYHCYQITSENPLVRRREIFGDRTFTYRDWIFSPEPLTRDFHEALAQRRTQISATAPPAPVEDAVTWPWDGLRFSQAGGWDERWKNLVSLGGISVRACNGGRALDLRASFAPREHRYLSHASYDFGAPPTDAEDWSFPDSSPLVLSMLFERMSGTVAVDVYLIGYRAGERVTHKSARLSDGITTIEWPSGTGCTHARLAFRVSGRGRCRIGPLGAYVRQP